MIKLYILRHRDNIKNIIMIVLGVSLMSIAVRVIYEPLNLVTGGVSGFAIVIRRISGSMIEGGIPVWITTGVVNIPLFVAGWFVKGRKYIIRSLFATILYTLMLSLIPEYSMGKEDYFFAAISGGVISGAGLGLVMRTVSSTGGTDLLGSIVRRFVPSVTIPQIIFVIDSVIVVMGAAVFGAKNAAYAIVAVYVTSKVLDTVLSGPNTSKMMIIVTEHEQEVTESIFETVERGATSVAAKGMYSGNEKRIVICAVSKKQLSKVVRKIHDTDPFSFVMITDSREIFGEGFVQADDYLA